MSTLSSHFKESKITRAYIGLGANMSDPEQQLEQALTSLSEIPESSLEKYSSFYRSHPMGPQDQDDYINAVACLATALPPLTLLDKLQAIEQQQGRVRKDERWGPRTLDLDLLLYNNDIINLPRLTVPHYGMKVRNFVLLPLHEISPKLIFPDGTLLAELIKNISHEGISQL